MDLTEKGLGTGFEGREAWRAWTSGFWERNRLTNEGDLVAPGTQSPTAQHGVISQVPIQAEVANEEPAPIWAEPQVTRSSWGHGPPFPGPRCSGWWRTASCLQHHLYLP